MKASYLHGAQGLFVIQPYINWEQIVKYRYLIMIFVASSSIFKKYYSP
jgi:hypothetical protein